MGRTIYIENGDMLVPYHYYDCGRCGVEIGESDKHFAYKKRLYCGECAFGMGIASEQEYLSYIGWELPGYKVGIHPASGEIEISANNGYFSWQETPRKQRQSSRYRKWRESVLGRDSHKCQECSCESPNLHVHHLKSFAKYKDLRYCIDNGITLCADCHRERHRVEGYS